MNRYNGGIPIGMEMESPACIRAYKAACMESETKRKERKQRKMDDEFDKIDENGPKMKQWLKSGRKAKQ